MVWPIIAAYKYNNAIMGLSISFADEIGLHKVENASHSRPAVSLHLYSPPFRTVQSFDEQTGDIAQGVVTFYNEHNQVSPNNQ